MLTLFWMVVNVRGVVGRNELLLEMKPMWQITKDMHGVRYSEDMMTKPWKERCSSLQQQVILLNGRISALEERLGKHECPDCGESGDGVFIDSPSGDYRTCNCCGHEWQNQ